MEADKNPFEAVRMMMIDTLENSRSATQSYLDLFERSMRSVPNVKEVQVGAFKAHMERRVAANHAFVDKLLRAKDFQAFRIQADYSRSQLKAAADDMAKRGSKMAASFNRSTG